MIGLYTGTEKQLRAMRKIRNQMKERGAEEGQIDKIELRMRAVMSKFNRRYAETVLAN